MRRDALLERGLLRGTARVQCGPEVVQVPLVFNSLHEFNACKEAFRKRSNMDAPRNFCGMWFVLDLAGVLHIELETECIPSVSRT